MNMIEKVARAMCRADGLNPDAYCKAYDSYNWEDYVALAKAAIEAMLEPSDSMISAVWACDGISGCAGCSDVIDICKAMINAALKEK